MPTPFLKVGCVGGSGGGSYNFGPYLGNAQPLLANNWDNGGTHNGENEGTDKSTRRDPEGPADYKAPVLGVPLGWGFAWKIHFFLSFSFCVHIKGLVPAVSGASETQRERTRRESQTSKKKFLRDL